MKKSFLAILLALVMCLSVVGLVACKDNKKPSGGDDGFDPSVLPTEEGKVTYYLQLGADSVAPDTSYQDIYLTGQQWSWATGVNALKMTRYQQTDVYYAISDYDSTVENATEFAVLLCYNENSGMPANKLGVVWDAAHSVKSDECKEFAYGSNAEFTMKPGSSYANLGKHTWSAGFDLTYVESTELRITFKAALGANAEVYIISNGWTEAQGKCAPLAAGTAQEDRQVWTLALSHILATTYDTKIIVVEDKELVASTEGSVVDWVLASDETQHAYVEISAGGSVLPISLDPDVDEGTYQDLFNTLSADETDKTGAVVTARDDVALDLSAAVLVAGEEEAPSTKILSVAATYTYKVTFETEVPTGIKAYLIGWMWTGDSGKWTEKEMTFATDRKSATVVDSKGLPGTYAGQIVLIHEDYEIASTQDIWDYGVSLSDGNNVEIVCAGFGEVEVTVLSDVKVPTITAPEFAHNVKFTVTFNNTKDDVEGIGARHVWLAGSMEGWTGTEMTLVDGTTATYEVSIAKLAAIEYKFKVVITSAATFSWADQYGAGGVLGATDAFITVPLADDATVQLFEEDVDVEYTATVETYSITFTATFDQDVSDKFIYLHGQMFNWSVDDALKLTVVDGTNGKTVSGTATVEAGVGKSFLVTINDTDAVNTAQKYGANGVFGAGDASIDIPAEDATLQLFGDTILEVPGEGVQVTLTWKFNAALEEKDVYFCGNISSWNPVKATTSDNINYSVTLDNVIQTNAEGAVLITLEGSTEGLSSWSYKFTGDGVYGAAGNHNFTIPAAGGTVEMFGSTVLDASAINIAPATVSYTATIRVTFNEPLPAATKVFAVGSWENAGGLSWGNSAIQMSSSDYTVYTASLTAPAGEYNFQVSLSTGANVDWDNVYGWDKAYGVSSSVGNAILTMPSENGSTIDLFEGTLTAPAAPTTVDSVTLTFILADSLNEDEALWIVGDPVGGWGAGAAVKLEKVDATHYTYTMTDAVIKTYAFRVGVSGTESFVYAGPEGTDTNVSPNAADVNAQLIIASDTTSVSYNVNMTAHTVEEVVAE